MRVSRYGQNDYISFIPDIQNIKVSYFIFDRIYKSLKLNRERRWYSHRMASVLVIITHVLWESKKKTKKLIRIT